MNIEIKKGVTYLSVSEITRKIKNTLESDFSNVAIKGELSGFKAADSGHWYFNLKDAGAVICCSMWRSNNSTVFFKPKDGMMVTVSGRITVYEPRGNYQIDVRRMQIAGEGELQIAFEKLKRELFEEGLFNEEHKKPIPSFPVKIGLITGNESAAYNDMIKTASERYPNVEIVTGFALVQGNGAAENIVQQIANFNKYSDVEILVLARGGGSIEDLWAFNEEIVARAIYNSKIPIITGIGHEIDTTIADYVSDLRAATPTAAIVAALPNKLEIRKHLKGFQNSIISCTLDHLNSYKKTINIFLTSYGFRMPYDLIKRKTQQLDIINYKIENQLNKKLAKTKSEVCLLEQRIKAHNVERILEKGFVLINQDSQLIPRLADFQNDKKFNVKFFDGEVTIANKNA